YACQSGNHNGGPQPVHALDTCTAGLGHVTNGNQEYRDSERKVHKKCPAPGGVLDEPSTGNRTKRSCDGRKARPRSNRLAPRLLVERRADDRETSRNEQRRTYALD